MRPLLQLWLAVLISVALRSAPAAEYYAVRHGWHSGIVVMRADIPPGVWLAGVSDRDFARCRCLELGWGDRAFYTSPHPTVAMAVRAAFVPGPSVLHLAGFAEAPAKAFPWTEIVRVPCTRYELTNLCRALGKCFALNGTGSPESLGVGLYGTQSHFYAARGRYWIGDTCNSWTLREVRASGLPTRSGPAGTLSSAAVTGQVRRLSAERDSPR